MGERVYGTSSFRLVRKSKNPTKGVWNRVSLVGKMFFFLQIKNGDKYGDENLT